MHLRGKTKAVLQQNSNYFHCKPGEYIALATLVNDSHCIKSLPDTRHFFSGPFSSEDFSSEDFSSEDASLGRAGLSTITSPCVASQT
jgi:hypothetical protein